jgi:hypothetical protein
MRKMVTLGALAVLAGLSSSAVAQSTTPSLDRGTPSAKPDSSDDAMTDVDPAVLAQCKDSAARRKLNGSAREQFIKSCVLPKD